MTVNLRPSSAIVPIVRASADRPVAEILGTGFFVGRPGGLRLVTAKHVFEKCVLQQGEQYAIGYLTEKAAAIVALSRIIASLDFDLAVADVALEHVPGAVPLALSRFEPPLNGDVFTFEYSCSRIERPTPTHTQVSFDANAHKGNVVRAYISGYPELRPTPVFLTSFPALQGASGAPVISGVAGGRKFGVVGMLMANVERHLMPAQVVEIQDGPNFSEKISYFLPFGKALAGAALTQGLSDMGVQFVYAEPSRASWWRRRLTFRVTK